MANRVTARGKVSPEVAAELRRLGYVVGGDESYTIDGKEGVYKLVDIQETTNAAGGVKIWCVLMGGDCPPGTLYSTPIGNVDQMKAAAVA